MPEQLRSDEPIGCSVMLVVEQDAPRVRSPAATSDIPCPTTRQEDPDGYTRGHLAVCSSIDECTTLARHECHKGCLGAPLGHCSALPATARGLALLSILGSTHPSRPFRITPSPLFLFTIAQSLWRRLCTELNPNIHPPFACPLPIAPPKALC